MGAEGPDTVVQGLTVTGGDAYDGGGMYVSLSSPTVVNCVFTGNAAKYGGGMYVDQSSPAVTDCVFTDNSVYRGGGMFVSARREPHE